METRLKCHELCSETQDELDSNTHCHVALQFCVWHLETKAVNLNMKHEVHFLANLFLPRIRSSWSLVSTTVQSISTKLEQLFLICLNYKNLSQIFFILPRSWFIRSFLQKTSENNTSNFKNLLRKLRRVKRNLRHLFVLQCRYLIKWNFSITLI